MLTPYPWQMLQWQQFLQALDAGKLAHGLLLQGAPGLGKRHFSRCMSARLLCHMAAAGGHACGECKSCILIGAGNHPDLIQVRPEAEGKRIRVDAVRELVDYLQLSSQYGRYKVAVITPAEAMNRHAANSLLKTLEEPPGSCLLILVSQQPSLLPITIRSRCQRYQFATQRAAVAVEWLQERLNRPEHQCVELLQRAGGAPLLAAELANSERSQRQDEVMLDLIELASAAADPTGTAAKWTGFDCAEILAFVIRSITEMTRRKLSATTELPSADSPVQNLQQLANGLDLAELLDWYRLVLDNFNAVTGPYSLNQQLLIEQILIQWQDINATRQG